jgi:hypothetical protein
MKITIKKTVELLDLKDYIVNDLKICPEYNFNKIISKMIDPPKKKDYFAFNTIFLNPEYTQRYTDPIERKIAIALKELVKNDQYTEILIHWDW